jgi:hypothetical protein
MMLHFSAKTADPVFASVLYLSHFRPQLYVNGEFIGGCDIVTSMYESGELKELLQEVTKEK